MALALNVKDEAFGDPSCHCASALCESKMPHALFLTIPSPPPRFPDTSARHTCCRPPCVCHVCRPRPRSYTPTCTPTRPPTGRYGEIVVIRHFSGHSFTLHACVAALMRRLRAHVRGTTGRQNFNVECASVPHCSHRAGSGLEATYEQWQPKQTARST